MQNAKENATCPTFPSTFKNCPVEQRPNWVDKVTLASVQNFLRASTPIVQVEDILNLRKRLIDAALGRAFVFQAGDCAEMLDLYDAVEITEKMQYFTSLAERMEREAGGPAIIIGRIAGQMAKPRSLDTETCNGITLPSYRGDMVNSLQFSREKRAHNPQNMQLCYEYAKKVYARVQEFNAHLQSSNRAQSAVQNPHAGVTQAGTQSAQNSHTTQAGTQPAQGRYDTQADTQPAQGRYDIQAGSQQMQVFISHEGLVLDFEECFVQMHGSSRPNKDNEYFCLSAHFLWIGERTRNPIGAHMEFFSHIANPIGVKIGPSVTDADLLSIMQKLDPDKETARVTLITRVGADFPPKQLSKLFIAVRDAGYCPVWICDPMHQNTHTLIDGVKTRSMADIKKELMHFFKAHKIAHTHPGGVHLELTHLDVTECTDRALAGIEGIKQSSKSLGLDEMYTTACDPRLNAQQGREIADFLADLYKTFRA